MTEGVKLGSVEFWTPTTVLCAEREFQTTADTLCQFEGTELHRLFSPPYPLYDEFREAHVLPPTLCETPDVFEAVLGFLRTGRWIMPAQRDFHATVCRTAALLELPSRPPESLASAPVEGRYDHEVVRLPVPMRGGRGLGGPAAEAAGVPPYDPNTNTCTMLSGLAFKGYGLHSERRVTAEPQTQPSALKAGTGGAAPAFRVPTGVAAAAGRRTPTPAAEPTVSAAVGYTEVTLVRQAPACAGVAMLAEGGSELFQRFLGCA